MANLPSVLAIRGELGRRSLRAFFKQAAWPVLQPATPFMPNWHIDAICEHLEAVSRGEIMKLIINMPFRMLKSSIVSQAWPAWDWLEHPSREFMTASYALDIATRDAVESRKIIESPDYQACYGHIFTMAGDQNVKTRYQNDKHGQRKVASTESGTVGFGGDIRIVDDPINTRKADSIIEINNSIEFWKGVMATRGNQPGKSPSVIVHQRVNVDDLTGYCLSHEDGWEHLVLPHRFDPERAKTTVLGFKDPRSTPGELIHPARVDEATTRDLEKTLGAYHTKAQLGQNPDPRGGVIFKREHWKYWKVLPAHIDEVIISVDCTFKGVQTSDYVSIECWIRSGANLYLWIGRIKEHLGFSATIDTIRGYVARVNMAFPGKLAAVLIEDKANGPAVIEKLQNEISGTIPIEPAGGKASRGYSMQPTQEAGNVWLPDPTIDPTIDQFVGTCAKFTGAEGGDDDEVDSMTQAVNWLRKRIAVTGIMDWYKTHTAFDDAEIEAARKQAERDRALATGATPAP